MRRIHKPCPDLFHRPALTALGFCLAWSIGAVSWAQQHSSGGFSGGGVHSSGGAFSGYHPMTGSTPAFGGFHPVGVSPTPISPHSYGLTPSYQPSYSFGGPDRSFQSSDTFRTQAANSSYRISAPVVTGRALNASKLGQNGQYPGVRGWGAAVGSDWFSFAPPRSRLGMPGWTALPAPPRTPVHTAPNPPFSHALWPTRAINPTPSAVPTLSATPITILSTPSRALFAPPAPVHGYWFSPYFTGFTPGSFLFYPQQLNPNIFNNGSNYFVGSTLEPRQSILDSGDGITISAPSLGGGMLMGYLNRSDTGPPFDIGSPYSLDEEMTFIPDQYGGYWISKSYLASALSQNAGVPTDMVYIPDAYGGYFISRSYLASALAAQVSGAAQQMPNDLVYVPDSYGGYFISRSYLASAMARGQSTPRGN